MLAVMDLVEHIHRLGGISDRATLVSLTSVAEFKAAVKAGAIVRDGHGRYAAPLADRARRAANALSGVVSHRSAAIQWGWEVKTVPAKPDVTVRRRRTVSESRREGVAVHWADLVAQDITADGGRTSCSRTLVDCLRSLPFDEALAIADSALRHESIGDGELVELAARVRGASAATCRRVAAEATGLAANPFESVLRAIALDVPGLHVVPQLMIRARNFSVQPDLVDESRRIVLEADSFAWHGDRQALRWDSRRYNNLVARGWLVLRFAWEDVMHDPDYVHAILTAIDELARERPTVH